MLSIFLLLLLPLLVSISLLLYQFLFVYLNSKAVDVSLPKFYGQRMRESLQMGPLAQNLSESCPYYYRFSIKMMAM